MVKKIWYNFIALFVLPDLQISEILIGMDGIERLVNMVWVKFKVYMN